MPEISKHEPGMFSWADLGTTDVAAAKAFYTALFGWTYQDDPMGPGAVYSRAHVGGKDVCAIYPQRAEQAKMGIPPHWSAYVTVESADETAAKVPGAGGQLAMPPFDVFDAGRMTVVMDPSGAVLVAWQPKKHIGAHVMNEHGALTWAELMTTDVDACGRFYSGVFGWKGEAMPMSGGLVYTVFNAGGKPATGMMPMPAELKGVPSHWRVYFAVTSCDGSVETAQRHGGKMMFPPTDIPGVGRFADLQDPQGVHFAILQPAT